MGARYYDQAVGRFTQAEPFTGVYALRDKYGVLSPSASALGLAGFYEPIAFNAYIYTASDPVNNTDPTGYWNWKKVLLGAILIQAINLPFEIALAAVAITAPPLLVLTVKVLEPIWLLTAAPVSGYIFYEFIYKESAGQ